jgi:endonuclease V-like protein UPF0215 family
VFGLAESGRTGSVHSILAGVVMRADFVIDGLIWDKISIQGTESSDTIVRLIRQLARTDLNGILLRGTIIAGYNIVDLALVHQTFQVPVISVTNEPQENLRSHLIHTFPSTWEPRWEIAQRNGDPQPLALETGATVFLQWKGTERNIVKSVIRRLTRFGGIPEPLRVARLLARALVKKPV